MESNNEGKTPRSWWKTDCPFCQQMRMVILWGIVMLVVYLVFWQ